MLIAEIPSWAPFALGIIIVTVILIRRSSRHYSGKRKRSPRSTQPKQPVVSSVSNDRPLADAPREILRWQVEMHETARDLKAELDGKIVALGILLRDAQHETQRLEAAVTRAEKLGITAEPNPLDVIEESAGPGGLADGVPQPDFVPDERIHDLAEQGYSANAIAQELGSSLGDIELALSLRAAR